MSAATTDSAEFEDGEFEFHDGQFHPAKTLTTPDGDQEEIDVEMVPLVEAIWALGLDTITCCQDSGESIQGFPRASAHYLGYAALEMPMADGLTLLAVVSADSRFKGRMHWITPDAWEMTLPVIAYSGTAEVYPVVCMRFPKDQLGDLVAVLAATDKSRLAA